MKLATEQKSFSLKDFREITDTAIDCELKTERNTVNRDRRHRVY